MGKSIPVLDRLMARRKITEDGCWEFTGTTSPKGYGEIGYSGKVRRAHRVAYERLVGEIPQGVFVLHMCDNPPCFNPEHLMLGTHKDNVDDMMKKGRSPCGEAKTQSKLTEAQVMDMRIRHLHGEGVCALARKFDISYGNVSAITRGVWWKHLPFGEALQRANEKAKGE